MKYHNGSRALSPFHGALLSAVVGIPLIVTACTVESEPDGAGGEGGADSGGTGGKGGSSGGTGGKGGATGGTSGEAGGGSGGSSGKGGGGKAGTTSGTAGEDAGGMGGEGGDPILMIDCLDRDVSAATEVSGAITADQTWQGTVLITDEVTIRAGAVITIEPGTNVIFDIDSGLEVGWNGNDATLVAQGTESEPIRFCGSEDAAGHWGSLTIGPGVSRDSVLSHVLVADGGGAADAALVLAADITVTDVLVKNSADAGVRASDFDTGSARLSVQDSAGAVVLSAQTAATRFPVGGHFTNNADNTARVAFTQINVDTVFHDIGIPYLQEQDVTTRAGSTVIFEAGVDYRFTTDTSLEVGWNNNDGRFEVLGTADDPVVMQGEDAMPGHWGGLIVRSGIRTDSRIDYLTLRHGGGTTRPFEILSPIVLDHVTLEDNAREAFIGSQGVAESSAALTISGSGAHPLTVGTDALPTLPRGGDYTGNASDWIAIDGGDFTGSGTIWNLGVPYRVEQSFDSRGDSNLTIEPGTVFEMTADTFIELGWNSNASSFTVEGTEAEPIVFRGAGETAGFWIGLVVGGGVTTDSTFDHVEISHAGGGSPAANLVLRQPISVTNSTFADSAGWGILKEAGNATDYTTGNTFTNVASGSVGNL